MNIAITGSGGYIGRKLMIKLRKENHTILVIPRKQLYEPTVILDQTLRKADGVIHLSGATILQRWTAKNKQEIYDSRVRTTENLVQAVNNLNANERPHFFIAVSAVGIYKAGESHSESSNSFANDFLGNVVKDWEKASIDLSPNVRRIIFRMGVVLGPGSKTLQSMTPLFRLGLGAILGNGKQAFPFIHIDDVLRAFDQAIKNEVFRGTYNLASPQRINNKQFSRALASQLNRRVFLIIPGFALKLVFGSASRLLLQSPEVIPQKLLDIHFEFNKQTITDTLLGIE